jgi:hypothetical protein
LMFQNLIEANSRCGEYFPSHRYANGARSR